MPQQLAQWKNVPSFRDDNIFSVIELITAISVEKELWIMLRSYSEVKSRGISLLRKYNISGRGTLDIWKRFRSYIRQADNYWQAASKTTYKSSSLLYYYSFLNLVKAYLLLENSRVPHDVHHGLSFNTGVTSTNLQDNSVTVMTGNNQIFPLYYRKVFSADPPARFTIISLLAYATDISYQFENGRFGRRRVFPFVYRIAIDKNRAKSWLVFTLPSVAPLRYYRSTFRDFFAEFEQVEKPQSVGPPFRELFGFKSVEWSFNDFYQSKPEKEVDFVNNSILVGIYIQKLKDILGFWLTPNYYSDQFSGYLSFPKNRRDRSPINEELAIYIVMFFMSEIVRYRPDFLDEIFDSRAAWLLESFVETSPLKFLRAITSRIVKQTIVIKNF